MHLCVLEITTGFVSEMRDERLEYYIAGRANYTRQHANLDAQLVPTEFCWKIHVQINTQLTFI